MTILIQDLKPYPHLSAYQGADHDKINPDEPIIMLGSLFASILATRPHPHGQNVSSGHS